MDNGHDKHFKGKTAVSINRFFEASQAFKTTPESASGAVWALIKDLFNDCPPGKSFAVNLPEGATDATLRKLVSRKAKEAGKTFKVVKHDVCYEVGRPALVRAPIADVEPIKVTPESFNGWSPNVRSDEFTANVPRGTIEEREPCSVCFDRACNGECVENLE